MTRPVSEEREKALKKRVHAMMRRDCDSIVPDRWCVETGVCSCQLMLDLLSTSSALREMREALSDLVDIIDAAGLINLSHGVQLGPTVWYVKASERLDAARAALSPKGEDTQACSPTPEPKP